MNNEVSANVFSYVTRVIDGIEVKFGKLTPRDRQQILTRLQAERKAKLIANLQTAGIDKEQVLVELEAFDDKPWGREKWQSYVNTPAGEAEILAIAWAKNNTGDCPTSIDDPLQLLCDVTGMKPVSEEGEEENPTGLRGYQGPPPMAPAPETSPTTTSSDSSIAAG